MSKKLTKLFNQSKKINITDNDKIVIMSDCHRGNGNNFDNFIKNKEIYEAALFYYYNNNFTYIELGDGDEMWEVKDSREIIESHIDTFKQLKEFYNDKRLIMIYGNHDIDKSNQDILTKNFYHYYDKVKKEKISLFKDLEVYESIILNYQNHDIFLIHGHQVDYINNELSKITRFIVYYIWRYLEHFLTKDPTEAAKNYTIKNKVEKKLHKWSEDNNKIIIAGHTHRPIFPKIGKSLYFNDGSCIHPNGITCIEIENGKICLVKWEFDIEQSNLLAVKRRLLVKSENIVNFYKTNKKK